MKKYSKKIALILVLALVLATAIPALAVSKSTTIAGAYQDIDLEIIVPKNVSAILNPYGLPVKIFADDGNTKIGSLEKPGQIATKPLVGVNMSEVDLKVGATVIGKTTGKFKFATSAPSKTATTNTGLVYLEMQAGDDLDLEYDYVLAADANALKNSGTTVCGGFNGDAVMTALNGWNLPPKYDKNKHLIIGAKTTTKSGMCTIAAGQPGADGEIESPSAGGYFMARLTGSIVQKPKNDWVTDDGFTATITWEFEPAPDETEGD